jgi:Iap family predicted aminopeptidase
MKDEIMKTIQVLTAQEMGGRLSGTDGAKACATFLAQQLSVLGVEPAGENGYYSYLDIYAARLNGEVSVKVGNLQLKHRLDFGEISRYSNPNGNDVTGELRIVSDEDEIEESELNGKIVLIPKKPKDFDLASTVTAAAEIGIKALFIESGNPRWFGKGICGARSRSIPVFRVRKDIARELGAYERQNVEIQLPLISKSLPCQNVLGLIPGKDSAKTLVLSAHYDHIGDDPNGYRFSGAVDNASGVAIVLNIARQLVGKPLPFNILIAFFTGEESGLRGAKHFLDNCHLPISAVINIDSLGFEPNLVKMRNGHKKPGNWLADLSADFIRKHGVEVAWIAGSEDSVVFQNEGITAIGLGQKPTDPKQRSIHTPDDTIENLFYEPIEKAHHIISDIVEYLIDNPGLL